MEDEYVVRKRSGYYKMDREKQWNERIFVLYAGLEKLTSYASDRDEKILNEVKGKFKSFFCNNNGKSKSTEKFRQMFKEEILKGTFKNEWSSDSISREIEDKNVNGNTLLLQAMSIHVEQDSEPEKVLNDIIIMMVNSCPELIFHPKKNGDYQVITPLHLAILNEDEPLLNKMAEASKNVGERRISIADRKNVCINGFVFKDTVMMAGTPLGVAALKLNKDIFRLVLEHFAHALDVTNENGDNIVHSLIHYAALQPDKMNEILDMIRYVTDYKSLLCEKREKKNKLLMMRNNDGMSPLQLSVKKQQYQIFELIMKNEVYHNSESGDGLFHEEVYDITEIETIELKHNRPRKNDHYHHESVLEYLVYQETRNAFRFVDCVPIKEVIRKKWRSYIRVFMCWFVIHLSLMIVLSFAAICRSKFRTPVPRNTTADYSYVVTKDTFVTVASYIGLAYGLIYLIIEIARLCIVKCCKTTKQNCKILNFFKRVKRHFSLPYSNLLFRIYFCFFSVLLIVDCILASVSGSGSEFCYENYCLIFAILIGWYLVLFFLKTVKLFSIFTVLIQRAITDMITFAVIMTILLFAFSVAMYMIMQGAETDEDDFEHFRTTLFKMLTIMLGIGDLDILFQARQPYLAIFVFICFVLLTTILLLNALIAMMSNTCTDLMSNFGGGIAAKLHCRLQKLSVILFLERFLPLCFCKEVGSRKIKNWYHNNEWVRNHNRRIWIRNSLQDRHNGSVVDKATHSIDNDNDVMPTWMQKLNTYIEDMTSSLKEGQRPKRMSPLSTGYLPQCSSLDITNYEIFTVQDKGTNYPEK